MSRRSRVRTGPRGWTLVELLVVVAILGILFGIGATSGYKALQRSRQSRAMADMDDIRKSIVMKGLSGDFPTRLSMRTCATCPWLPWEPKDPWGNRYLYTGGGNDFELRCLGRDGKPSAGITPATRDDFDLDIVMKSGHFVNEPYTNH